MSARFLVDTDVLSTGGPSKAQPIPGLIEWMDRNSEKLCVSVVTIAEIEGGIAKSGREGARRKAAGLREWLETLVHLYSPRILPFDLAAARVAGCVRWSTRPRHTLLFHLAVAAIARHHDLTILTCNLKHSVPLGVPLHDPVAELPPH